MTPPLTDAQRAELTTRIVARRAEGLTFKTIAIMLGVKTELAWRLYARHRRAANVPVRPVGLNLQMHRIRKPKP